MSLIVSAPGSIMICGEHAVVYGHSAVVAAIEQRIYINFSPSKDGKIHIYSQFPDYESAPEALLPNQALRFVLACLSQYPQYAGITLKISSNLDHTLGLGSSAAVTIATLGGLAHYNNLSLSPLILHKQALQIIRHLQGYASGADLAASLWGGIIAYHPYPKTEITPLNFPPAIISLSNCGYKTPTAVVLANIAQKMQQMPTYYQRLYNNMGKTTQSAIQHNEVHNWPAFYAALNEYETHLDSLGVCDEKLSTMLTAAHQHSDTLASKISGSGLGDCIVTFSQTLPAGHTKIDLAHEGLMIHE